MSIPASPGLAAAADALARRLLAHLPADRPRTRADLDRLPEPVARLLHVRLDGHADAAAPPPSAWVDPEGVRQAVRAAGQYPEAEWPAALATAARLALAHLVRPAETLAAYAFAGEPGDLPAAEALDRLGAFGPYPYLPEIAARYVDKKGMARLGPAGTERVLRQIDRRMAETFSAQDWLDLVVPLADLCGREGVPAPLLRDLLASKGRDDLAAAFPGDAAVPDARQRLAERLGVSADTPHAAPTAAGAPDVEAAPNAAETSDALSGPHEPEPASGPDAAPHAPGPPAPRSTVERAPPAAPPPRPAVEVLTIEPDQPAPSLPLSEPVSGPPPILRITDEPPAPAPPPPAPPEADEPDDLDGDEPIWKRLARQAEQAARHAPDPHPHPTPPETQEPLWQRFAVPRDAPAPEAPPVSGAALAPVPLSLDDLEARVLGQGVGERRAWYVSELFGGSADDYRQTLGHLDAVRTWTAATEIIARDVFRKHRVNIYTEAAVTFTDAVESRIERRP